MSDACIGDLSNNPSANAEGVISSVGDLTQDGYLVLALRLSEAPPRGRGDRRSPSMERLSSQGLSEAPPRGRGDRWDSSREVVVRHVSVKPRHEGGEIGDRRC